MNAGQDTLLWDKLVTEGHVRAARLRSVQIPIIAIGIVVLLLALIVGDSKLNPPDFTKRSARIDETMAEKAALAKSAVAKLNPPVVTFRELQAIPTQDEIGDVVAAVLESLNETGELPENLKVQRLRPAEFWTGEWEAGSIGLVQKRKVQLLGAIVSDPAADLTETAPAAKRWLGVFRKQAGTWKAASVEFEGSYLPDPEASVSPGSVALSLGAAL